MARRANFRHALWQMGGAVADLFERVVERQPLLQRLPVPPSPTWRDLARRWRRGQP